jgi:hypothetical protein
VPRSQNYQRWCEPMIDWRDYQTQVLFLLVGANPLPDYVAALLLAKEDASIYLLHSRGPRGTIDIAERLKRAIEERRPSANVTLHGIDDADADRIEAQVGQLISTLPSNAKAIGLNYTGGTKPMAAHTYHVLRKHFPDGCFSYLDARSLRMMISRGDQPTQRRAAGQAVQLGLEELLALHGYLLPANSRPTPKPPVLCRAMAQVHSTPDGFKQWRAWTKKLDKSPSLPSLDDYPAVGPVLEALSEICDSSTPTEGSVARALGFEKFTSCSKFLIGEWLEDYTFHELAKVADDLGIADCAMRIKPIKAGKPRDARDMDLDAAAMCGYQLFAISCIATDRPEPAKDHLFEVFVRARQLGGDEARFALVSCVRDTASLHQEVEQTWDAEGRIRVFGQRDLLSLAQRLEEWFRTANKEVR